MQIELTRTYTIHMTERDAIMLKKVLGGLKDNEFALFGVSGEDRCRMHDLWNLLPDEHEDS